MGVTCEGKMKSCSKSRVYENITDFGVTVEGKLKSVEKDGVGALFGVTCIIWFFFIYVITPLLGGCNLFPLVDRLWLMNGLLAMEKKTLLYKKGSLDPMEGYTT